MPGLALSVLISLLTAADHAWFVKELSEREKRLTEEFRRGGWLLRIEATLGKHKLVRVFDWKNAGSYFVFRDNTVRTGEHQDKIFADKIFAANQRYGMYLHRFKAAAPYQLIELRPGITPEQVDQQYFASMWHVAAGRVSERLASSGKEINGRSSTFEIIDIGRSHKNGIGRIVARFRDESRRGQELRAFRREITYREDLGWAIEKDYSYKLSDGKEHLVDAVDLTYDLSRGKRADLALTRQDWRASRSGPGSLTDTSVLTVLRRDPQISSEAETTLSFYGFPEPESAAEGSINVPTEFSLPTVVDVGELELKSPVHRKFSVTNRTGKDVRLVGGRFG